MLFSAKLVCASARARIGKLCPDALRVFKLNGGVHGLPQFEKNMPIIITSFLKLVALLLLIGFLPFSEYGLSMHPAEG